MHAAHTPRTEVSLAFVDSAREYLSKHYLPKIERCLEQLSDEQIWWRPNQESNSIGNLILHLCGNARQWIISGVGGSEDNRQRDTEFNQTEPIASAQLVELLRSTINEIDLVLASLSPSSLLQRRKIQGLEVDTVEAIFHVTEHFSMHTGQIILLTKLIGGKDLQFYDFSSGAPHHRWETT